MNAPFGIFWLFGVICGVIKPPLPSLKYEQPILTLSFSCSAVKIKIKVQNTEEKKLKIHWYLIKWQVIFIKNYFDH